MSSVDWDRYDDRGGGSHRSHRHHDRRDDRQPRYVETQETYVRAPAPTVPEPPYDARTTEVIRRPVREDSDLSIEEVRRDFPPPGAGGAYIQNRSDRYAPSYRSRSAERGYYYADSRGSYKDDDRRSRKGDFYAEEKIAKPRRRSLSRNQKIIAGVAGAALAVGGKELWDRKQASNDGRPRSRNHLQTAAVGAAGAFAGYEATDLYAKHGPQAKAKKETYIAHKGRNGEIEEYYSSEEESVKPKRSKSRRKSIMEGALGLAGMGTLVGKSSNDRDRDRDGDYRSRRGSGSRSRGRSPEGPAKFQQAAKAALLAGATEAFRVRNEPGGWGGDKGKRIITAAIGAGGIDAAADRDPDRKSKRHILEAVVGGLAGNRLINGPRDTVEDEHGRSRSRSRRTRSRSRGPAAGGSGGLAALATAGLGAIAGKKLLDRSRSRSRHRNHSPDSYDSRSPSPRRGERRDRHKRSKSVTDYARTGLAALGIGKAAGDSRGDVREIQEDTYVRRSRRGGSDDGYSKRSHHGNSSRDIEYGGGRDEVYGDPRYADSRSSVGRRSNRDKGAKKYDDSESDLGSSTDDEKRAKKMKGKQLITAGLASVATIHAAHNIYQSMEKRDARQKAVAEGEMSPEEARKLKAKATLQDVASVGIAALGIKGAFSEIKEANELRVECKEFREQKAERHQKRVERLQRQKAGGKGSGGRRRDDRYDSYDNRYDYGPQYVDGNPYAGSLPAPPVGYDRR